MPDDILYLKVNGNAGADEGIMHLNRLYGRWGRVAWYREGKYIGSDPIYAKTAMHIHNMLVTGIAEFVEAPSETLQREALRGHLV